MTKPAIVKAGDVVFVTIHVVARLYMLRPDPELVRAVKYVVAHYAEKHGLVLHALNILSTHIHFVYTDANGEGPKFRECAHRGIANVVKALRGTKGAVFDGAPNKTRLKTAGAVVDKIGYTMANGVTSFAVEHAKQWPGLLSHFKKLDGSEERLERPKLFYSKRGEMPSHAVLRFRLPSFACRSLGRRGTLIALRRSVAEHERAARAEAKRRGWKFLGKHEALRVSPFRRAKAYQVWGGLNPHFATKGGTKQTFLDAVEELRAFRASYAEALVRWRTGDRLVLFPHGTYKMKALHGVCCRSGP